MVVTAQEILDPSILAFPGWLGAWNVHVLCSKGNYTVGLGYEAERMVTGPQDRRWISEEMLGLRQALGLEKALGYDLFSASHLT